MAEDKGQKQHLKVRRAGKRARYKVYAMEDRRRKNKERRIAKDARRAKPMSCGHGSRHRHPDGGCRRCWSSAAKKLKRAKGGRRGRRA